MPHTPSCAPLNHRFVRRLGPHHFAHLRAVAEGLAIADCARRYLGAQHGHEAVTAHRQAVDAVRAVARRQAESAWRLVGLTIRAPSGAPRPSLDAFAQQHGLDGFSESEVLALYAEAFPLERKTARGQRLRERQLALLRRLEGLAAETPQPGDSVAGWFDDALAAKLVTAGLLTLGDLNARVSAGGAWYRSLPAVGVSKARRIERHLATLLPRQAQPPRLLFALSATPALFDAPLPAGSSPGPASVELMRGDGGGQFPGPPPAPSPFLTLPARRKKRPRGGPALDPGPGPLAGQGHALPARSAPPPAVAAI